MVLSGCQNPGGPNSIHTPIYYGPTLPLSQLIESINANNQKLPTLWTSLSFEATIVDPNTNAHFVNGDGVLLYRAPDDFRLVGSKELVGTVFDLGTNAHDYWLKVVPEVDTLWYGLYADLNDAALAAHQIPIEPEMILQVLGIAPIDSNFNDLPAPTLRFNNDADAYMVVWNAKLPDRWVAQREVWYDRATLAPMYVFLFDANGRVILRARLSNRRQVRLPDVAEKDWPWMAGQYSLFFPENRSKMELTLRDVMVHKGDGARAVPNDRSFKLPDPDHAGVGHVVQIR